LDYSEQVTLIRNAEICRNPTAKLQSHLIFQRLTSKLPVLSLQATAAKSDCSSSDGSVAAAVCCNAETVHHHQLNSRFMEEAHQQQPND